MSVQIIKSKDGEDEFALVPIEAYNALKRQIDDIASGEYELLRVDDFVSNPIALMRIKDKLTQNELADKMHVTQAYVSKLEGQQKIPIKAFHKVKYICRLSK